MTWQKLEDVVERILVKNEDGSFTTHVKENTIVEDDTDDLERYEGMWTPYAKHRDGRSVSGEDIYATEEECQNHIDGFLLLREEMNAAGRTPMVQFSTWGLINANDIILTFPIPMPAE